MKGRGVALLCIALGVAAGWLLRGPLTTPPSTTPAPPPSFSATESASASPTQKAFENIYKNGVWGVSSANVGHSGSGSLLETTVAYRAFLQQFMKENRIRSVVDAGCGDWEFSQAIDWTGIEYKGFDIVPSVIEGNKAKFAKPTIQFFAANIVDTDLPAADLHETLPGEAGRQRRAWTASRSAASSAWSSGAASSFPMTRTQPPATGVASA